MASDNSDTDWDAGSDRVASDKAAALPADTMAGYTDKYDLRLLDMQLDIPAGYQALVSGLSMPIVLENVDVQPDIVRLDIQTHIQPKI